jgi:hypothetical protein
MVRLCIVNDVKLKYITIAKFMLHAAFIRLQSNLMGITYHRSGDHEP